MTTTSLQHRRGGAADPIPSTTTSASGQQQPVVLIVGGGPCGASIAKSLAEKNVYRVQLVEAYAHPKHTIINKQRSPKHNNAHVISLRARGQRCLRSTTGVEPQDVTQAVISHHMVRHPSNTTMTAKTPALVAPRQVLTLSLIHI